MTDTKSLSISKVTQGLQEMHSSLDDDGKRVLAALLRQASMGSSNRTGHRIELAPDLAFDLVMMPEDASW